MIKSNVSNVNVLMFSCMPSDFGAWLFDFGYCKVKTHLNNSVKCIMLSLLLISFPSLLYLVGTGVDERISIMWEETGVLREKPPGEASDRHTLSHTTNFDRGNQTCVTAMRSVFIVHCAIPNRKVPFLIDLVCTVNFKFLGYSRMLKPYF